MRVVYTLIFISFFLLAWQLFQDNQNQIRISNNQTSLDAFIGSPITILEAFVEKGNLIFYELQFTLIRAGVGLIIGIVLAFFLAFLFVLFPELRVLSLPLFMSINSFPIIGFAPIIILAFGQGSSLSIIFIAMLISYFPVLITIDSALQNTDKQLLDVMRSLRATKKQMITKLYLPIALPTLLTSLKLAIPASIIGTTIGEWLGTRNGIGQLVTISLYQLHPGLLYASLLTVSMVSVLCIGLVGLIEKKFFSWYKR